MQVVGFIRNGSKALSRGAGYIGVALTIAGCALVVLSALVFSGASHNITQFLVWAAFAAVLVGIIVHLTLAVLARDDSDTSRVVSTMGASVAILLLGFALSFALAPGLVTWFGMLLLLAIPAFLYTGWRHRKMKAAIRTRKRRDSVGIVLDEDLR
jgi:hypothetical protein